MRSGDIYCLLSNSGFFLILCCDKKNGSALAKPFVFFSQNTYQNANTYLFITLATFNIFKIFLFETKC